MQQILNQFLHSDKTVLVCDNCYQKIRVPRSRKKIRVTCPVCRSEFDYQYYGLGFSSRSLRPALVGLAAGIAGFWLCELLTVSKILSGANFLFRAVLFLALFGASLGAIFEAAEGFLKRQAARQIYGLKSGAILGLLSGSLAGLLAQSVFSALLLSYDLEADTRLWTSAPGAAAPFVAWAFARLVGWSILGGITGMAFGVYDNDWAETRSGLLRGLLAGALSGICFELADAAFPGDSGSIARLAAFCVLGAGLGLAVFRFKRMVLRQGRPMEWNQEVITKAAPKVDLKTDWSKAALVYGGIVLFIGGIALVIGNQSGALPTFPLAGFFTSGLGLLMVSQALK